MLIKQNNKDNYKYQPYLDKVKNIEHRKSVTRLRCSATFWKKKSADTLTLSGPVISVVRQVRGREGSKTWMPKIKVNINQLK